MSRGLSNVNLKQLEIFRAIVVAGSFTKAVSLTELSQPTLSQQLANLEKQLQTQLIVRGKKTAIELTPAGEFWLARTAEILSKLDSALTTHFDLFVEQGIIVKFGTTPSLQGRFDELISGAAVHISQIKALNIHSYLDSRHVADALAAHRINLGIASLSSLEEQKSSLQIVHLYDDRIVWAVPASIPVEDVIATVQSRKNVGGHPSLDRFVTLGQVPPWYAKSADWYRDKLPFAQPFFSSATHQSAVQIAASGHATCHTPMTLIPNLSESVRSRLRYYDIGEIARRVCLAYPKHLQSIRPFVEFTSQVHDIVNAEIVRSPGFVVLKPENAALAYRS